MGIQGSNSQWLQVSVALAPHQATTPRTTGYVFAIPGEASALAPSLADALRLGEGSSTTRSALVSELPPRHSPRPKEPGSIDMWLSEMINR